MPDVSLSIVKGVQVPLIPLSEIAGSVGTEDPGQMVMDEPKLNAGTIDGFTVTANEVEVPHCPVFGVKL
jgi:hypothetical protein